MLDIVCINGREYDAEVFEYDHHGYPLEWAVYNEAGEDITDTFADLEQQKAADQLVYTREERLADATLERYKEEGL